MSSTLRHGLLTNKAVVAALTLLLTATTQLASTAPVWAQPPAPAATCAAPITTAPVAAARVASVSTSSFGRVLVVGAGPNAGCSLYMLTSDQPGATPPRFACSGTGAGSCPTTIWPALLTNGAPVAGPGVNASLLGTVTRTDILASTSVQQVTYNGFALYQFVMDPAPGQTNGTNFFDPFTTPQGVWYLLSPGHGLPDPGVANLSKQTVSVSSTGTSATVLTTLLDQGLGGQNLPVYTFSADSGHQSACVGACAVSWPPLLTTSRVPVSGAGLIMRPDGSLQVTFGGHPLYLFARDAVLPGSPRVAHGSGVTAFGGTFYLIPPQ
jgi:predicted lipoprotein with Yx(FWY)xxD motif